MNAGAQHQRAEDAPEQHPVLVLRGHLEVGEDQRPHEHVVDRQALLDQVAGELLAAGRAAERRRSRRLPNVTPTATHAIGLHRRSAQRRCVRVRG